MRITQCLINTYLNTFQPENGNFSNTMSLSPKEVCVCKKMCITNINIDTKINIVTFIIIATFVTSLFCNTILYYVAQEHRTHGHWHLPETHQVNTQTPPIKSVFINIDRIHDISRKWAGTVTRVR